MKNIFFFLIWISVSIDSTYPQDTIQNKTMYISEFEIITKKLITKLSINNPPKTLIKVTEFSGGKSIALLNDSTFRIWHNNGMDDIKYNDISEIIFIKSKTKFITGTWQGALCGAAIGLIGVAASDKKDRGTMWYGIPIFTVLGSLTGGIIGIFLHEKEDYDLTKYKPEQRKQNALSIFFRYSVKF